MKNKNLERKENNQSDDYISYTARRNMAELAVKHVWVKFRFHRAWHPGVGGHRYTKDGVKLHEP
jgi:hypothetical protein